MCAHKAFGVALIGLSEDLLWALDELLGPTVVEGFGGKQADAAVMVLGVVLGEEGLTETAGAFASVHKATLARSRPRSPDFGGY
jgi:hypothetical protein